MSNLAALEYYQMLGVSRRATRDDIDKAFKEIIERCRIDRIPSVEELPERATLNESDVHYLARAYYTLMDENTRKDYDKGISQVRGWDGKRLLVGAEEFYTSQAKSTRVSKAFGRFGVQSDEARDCVSLIEDPESMADVIHSKKPIWMRLLRKLMVGRNR